MIAENAQFFHCKNNYALWSYDSQSLLSGLFRLKTVRIPSFCWYIGSVDKFFSLYHSLLWTNCMVLVYWKWILWIMILNRETQWHHILQFTHSTQARRANYKHLYQKEFDFFVRHTCSFFINDRLATDYWLVDLLAIIKTVQCFEINSQNMS